MDKSDINSFFADPSELELSDYIIEDYFFESVMEPRAAAARLCMEQSTAQWRRVGVNEDLRELHGAKVIDLKVERVKGSSEYPLLSKESVPHYSCRVKIAHPHRNFGAKIPNLLTAVCGEGAFFCPGITVIKLFDIEFPDSYLSMFEGPQFGIEGLREMLGIYERPFFFGVIKPNIGLGPSEFAELAYLAWLGGLDVAKDDEMLSNTEWSPLKLRSYEVSKKMRLAEKETGERKMYVANITDEVDHICALHDIALENGANAVMLNSMTVGLSAVRMLRKYSEVPIVGHFDFIAPFSRLPYFGVSSKLITKLQRIAGCDSIVMPGFGNRMKTPDYEVIANVHECLRPLGNIRPSLPIPGGGDWAGTLPEVFNKLDTVDFGFIPGRGVFSHPEGPRSGAKSLRQAWEAIKLGVPIVEYAKDRRELKSAIEAFGAR